MYLYMHSFQVVLKVLLGKQHTQSDFRLKKLICLGWDSTLSSTCTKLIASLYILPYMSIYMYMYIGNGEAPGS